MANKKLHPSIEEFKAFAKARPRLLEDVRRGDHTLQELYEDWYLLGEEDPRWDAYKDESTSVETKEDTNNSTSGKWMSQIGSLIQRLDANQVQHHVNSLSEAIGAIQGVISQFQGAQSKGGASSAPEVKNPFSFRKD
ncbi:YlbD family protein [Heyndrickxia acidicola]|uniref:YlbD family protein n=1 Tax=Heyndrickxia acidicola TaxID=209389 RepID=A0ABU6MBZ0_9BACI|nr:YlbD family protein [Heyndrickxia acidicola]MED1202195.1 YlbD family protein [Heyndrickxia acidicola]